MPVTATPFPLGAYLGNPDNSSPANEALYQAKDASFTALMGVGPRFLTTFIDQRQTVVQWTGNSQFFADSAAQSPDAMGMTPVIALPLSSTAPGSGTPSQQFQAFAAGQYDDVITGIVRVWAQRGFADLVVRPGWEMNLPGSNYAGDDAKSQADWVRAFQHVYTVLHQAAVANGVNVQVVWNPGVTNYSNAGASASLYPGDDHVDIVGADMYADIYPYSDSLTPSYHDWHTGLQDTTVSQFIADPINREHYWSLPAATAYSSDGSGGHSQSLDSLIRFAEAHGKPFAMPETGAGNSDAGTGVKDDGAFPGWLAAQLAASTARGGKIAFVNLWDSNGGGNYQFSAVADGKPQEAAAWAKYFGAVVVATPIPALTPVRDQAPVVAAPTIDVAAAGAAAIVLGVTMPTDPYSTADRLTIAVSALPTNGTITLADGVTPVKLGQTLTPGQLTGLLFAGSAGMSGRDSSFAYTVTDPVGNTTSGSVTLALSPSVPSFAPRAYFTNNANLAINGTADAGTTVTLMEAGMAIGNGTADSVTGAFSITPATPLASGLNILTSTETTIAGTSAASAPLEVLNAGAPIDGVSTADFSSADLAALLNRGATFTFIGGTEAIQLTDSTLSVGPNTNEATIQRLYKGLLGRSNDVSGMTAHDSLLSAGESKQLIAASFLNGSEYLASHGTQTDAQFVTSIYVGFMGRAPEEEGMSGWTTGLAAGMSRAEVAVGIADASEAKTHLAGATTRVWAVNPAGTLAHELYETGLAREVELAALPGFKAEYAASTPAQIADRIAASPEFLATHHGQSNAGFVASLYQSGLGRAPEADGAASWVGALNAGASSGSVLLGIATSAEATAHLTRNIGV